MSFNYRMFPIFAAAIVAGVAWISPASADVIPPDEASCTNADAGAACTVDGDEGHCAAAKCSHLDYSDGSPPSTVTVDCLKCVTTGADDDAGPTTGSDAGPVSQNDAGNKLGANDDAGNGAKDAGNTSNGSSGGGSSGGCDLAAAPIARGIGPWLVALVPMFALRRRKKKQS